MLAALKHYDIGEQCARFSCRHRVCTTFMGKSLRSQNLYMFGSYSDDYQISWHVKSSSLANVPNAGPFALFSRILWAFPRELRGSITQDLPDLHKKLGRYRLLKAHRSLTEDWHARLGPLIRISPNEISYYSLSTYETVLGAGSKFRKDPKNYGGFVQGGHPALFSVMWALSISLMTEGGLLAKSCRSIVIRLSILEDDGLWVSFITGARYPIYKGWWPSMCDTGYSV